MTPTDKRTIAMAYVQSAAHRFGVSEDDILGESRLPVIARSRQWVYSRLIRDQGASVKDVARLMQRDRATVRYGAVSYAHLPHPQRAFPDSLQRSTGAYSQR